MKFTMKQTLIPALTTTVISISAYAAADLTLVDSDGDGVISAAEIQAAHDARKAAILEQFDTDADGELSREERRAVRDARHAAALESFDADGDGELSRAETTRCKRRTTRKY